MGCLNICKLSDQVHLASRPSDGAGRTEVRSLTGCRICGLFHEFVPVPGAPPDVVPIAAVEAARVYRLAEADLRAALGPLKAAAAVVRADGPPVWSMPMDDMGRSELRLSGDAAAQHFSFENGCLVARTLRRDAPACWTNLIESAHRWYSAETGRLVRVHFSTGGDVSRMFAIGLGVGDDYAGDEIAGHYLHVYGEAAWAAARGPAARCMPTQFPLKAETRYVANFEVGFGRCTVRLRPDGGSVLDGFVHQTETTGWESFTFRVFALGSPEVVRPAELHIHSAQVGAFG